jgi:hypothetical protein
VYWAKPTAPDAGLAPEIGHYCFNAASQKKPGSRRAFALPNWQIAYFCCGGDAGLLSPWFCCGVDCGLVGEVTGATAGFWVSFCELMVIGFPFEKTEIRIQYLDHVEMLVRNHNPCVER